MLIFYRDYLYNNIYINILYFAVVLFEKLFL